MENMHRLLKKQIELYMDNKVPIGMEGFVEAVNEAYLELGAIENFQLLQSKLAKQEKLPALGQLIAGVAHEINTPLGAIKASYDNLSAYIKQLFEQLPVLFNIISPEQQKVYFELHKRCIHRDRSITIKEERRLKRALIDELEQYSINDSDIVADLMIEMGIYSGINSYMLLLEAPEALFILQSAYNFSGLLRNIENIGMAVERASKMVFALKNYSRHDYAGEMRKADVVFGIETVLTLYYNQIKQATEVIKNYGQVPQIFCYPDELNQVWTNIIHNALQAMDYKGILEIEVLQDDEMVVVKITDSGKGIPDNIKDRIFEPFFTTKLQGEGTGLGLDIVKKIIVKHSGEISFTSEPGKTTFSVKLPINAKLT